MDDHSPREKWNAIYGKVSNPVQCTPAGVLSGYAHLLPRQGVALDLACGCGGNALFLASRGLDVWAWDISSIAIDILNKTAAKNQLFVHTEVRNVEAWAWDTERFDVVVVSRFLSRALTGRLVNALKPGGLLFYQTFSADKVDGSGPTNPAYLLRENELLHLVSELRIVFYREEGRIGDLSKGFRNEVQLIGQRRDLI